MYIEEGLEGPFMLAGINVIWSTAGQILLVVRPI